MLMYSNFAHILKILRDNPYLVAWEILELTLARRRVDQDAYIPLNMLYKVDDPNHL